MSQVIADVYKANMEVVRSNALPVLYEKSNFVSAKIMGNIEKHQITKTPNGNDFRAPFEYADTSQFGTFSLNGGALGRGGSFQLNQFVQTYFPMSLNFEITREANWGTNSASVSVVNTFRKTMKEATKKFQRYDDVSFFNITGNQGIIAVTTGLSGTTYTCDNNFGCNLLQPGQPVEIFNSDLSLDKTNSAGLSPDSLPVISAVNKINKTVTLTGTSGMTAGNAPAAGDQLLFKGVATTPVWMNGLYYFNNPSATTLLGVTTSSYPEVLANGYSANSGTLTPQMALLIQHRIYNRRGELPKGLKGIMNTAQHAAILNTGINISTWFRGKTASEKMIDVMPEVSDMVDFCGVPTYLSTHANQSRIDLIDTDKWGRVWFGKQAVDFYEDLEGRRMFPAYASNGGIATSDLFYLVCVQNYYCVDAGSGGAITSLALPSGY